MFSRNPTVSVSHLIHRGQQELKPRGWGIHGITYLDMMLTQLPTRQQLIKSTVAGPCSRHLSWPIPSSGRRNEKPDQGKAWMKVRVQVPSGPKSRKWAHRVTDSWIQGLKGTKMSYDQLPILQMKKSKFKLDKAGRLAGSVIQLSKDTWQKYQKDQYSGFRILCLVFLPGVNSQTVKQNLQRYCKKIPRPHICCLTSKGYDFTLFSDILLRTANIYGLVTLCHPPVWISG